MQKRKLGVNPSGRSGLQLHFRFADANLSLTAMTHEIERQRTVMQVLLEIFMMVGFGMLDKTDRISVKGAEVQDERANGGEQAAHYLPRQLIVNTVSLQNVAHRYSTELSDHIKALFARTEHLPANYNRADAKAEINGMDIAFRYACQLVIESSSFLLGSQDPNSRVRNAPTFLKAAINNYQEKAKGSFHLAIKGLEEKLKGERVFETERERWTMQIEILRSYLRVSGIHQAISEELTAERIEGAFLTYTRYINRRS